MAINRDTTSDGKISVWKAVSAIEALLLAGLSALLGWVSFSVFDLQLKVTALEASVFTASNAYELRRELDIEFGRIEDKVSNISQDIKQLPKEIPPPWFKNQVEMNQQKIDKLYERIRNENIN